MRSGLSNTDAQDIAVVCDQFTYASQCCGVSGTKPGCLDGLSGNPLRECSSVNPFSPIRGHVRCGSGALWQR